MAEVDKRATAILLADLEQEIEMKCIELKEKQQILKQKNIFFISCTMVVVIFLLQMFFNIFNVNIIIILLIYQVAALLLVTPLILNIKSIRR